MSVSRLFGVVIALQLLIVAGQWLGAPSYVTPVQAQALDPARDRQQALDEMKSINVKLDKLIEILESGDLQVRVVQPDDNKAAKPAR